MTDPTHPPADVPAHDDDHDPSVDGLDLTPTVAAGGTSSGGPNWRNLAIGAGFVIVAGLVLFQALTNARVFFYNVDEAVANRAELGDRTFRMQGTVQDEPAKTADGSTTFVMMFGGQEATVHHVGAEPSDLFRAGEQVVAEGRWLGNGDFQSSQLLIKHSEEYIEDNPDRVDPS